MTQPSYQSLVADNRRLCEEIAALRDENAALRKRLGQLQAALEAAERNAKENPE